MREIIRFNSDWLYTENFQEEYINKTYDDSKFNNVMLPHANKTIPYNYFDEHDYQFVSCYRKHFCVEDKYKGKMIFVDFEGVMTYAKCYINGRYVGEHKGGYTPFSIDVTDYIVFNEENVLTVMVDSTEREDIPPFGKYIDYLCYGGIYREVSLRIVENVYIKHAFVRTKDILCDEKKLEADVYISSNMKQEQNLTIQLNLIDSNGNLCKSKIQEKTIKEGKEKVLIDLSELSDINLWDIDDPNLYEVEIILISENITIDRYVNTIGFRSAGFTETGFYLNGKHINLVGLNRHQSFPYVGYAMPKRAQEKDADILKDLGLNIVRTSHYPQSRHFLNRCDEIGLLVLEETPGWQHIGDKAWQEIACNNVEEMITRDYNHPSIILWGVRINESPDNHDFYVKTNEIAHRLDNVRQTGGIRCINDSELLEDVYTMNDFDISQRRQQSITGLDHLVPYLVTEKIGHMYPTKRFDKEERLIEHANRHLCAHNETYLDSTISGLICWCAFDYNTHHNFGSGDRICYHGVMDMFRIPKMAAGVYRSQKDPEKEPVLEPATIWTNGERDGSSICSLTIYTNCDRVDMYMGDKMTESFYPDRDTYRGLPHPPVIIKTNFSKWGSAWDDVRFVGFINDQKVIENNLCKNPIATQLIGEADDTILNSGDWDTTRIVYKCVDQKGNLLPFINELIEFDVEGEGEVIGPDKVGLIGGCIGVWIRTTGKKGNIVVKAKCSRFEANTIKITVQ
ncbi:beta-galactosidase [Vallitalea longa]|uniref:Beta-galactosidase n=1 Tax=Vallitalea longa TaxID=2936439 RepID=A0A9W5Y8D1_9FIRM|nr:glycoside hydrolase family 2 TIM barrel-domain containing protein [Vallitalea longa]GKX27608.1 beta-galactosidase [Vallitalea longa]